MKKVYFILYMLCLSVAGFAQTDAISYQAVILNPDEQQLPGFDATRTVLKDTDVTLRFSIINDDQFFEYQEMHSVTTDSFGMVNLYIGEGTRMSNLAFNEILWNGTSKLLLVEIDFYNLGEFVQLSSEKLTFTPQAFHRDIIATGDMTVDGKAIFKDDFLVRGETIINNDLQVTGNTVINGNADIMGTTFLRDDLTVNGVTNLNRELFVNNGRNTVLSGELEVGEQTTIGGGISVENEATIGGAATIGEDLSVGGDQTIAGDLSVDRTLTVLLPTTLNDDLTVGGRTDLGGALTVDGFATIDDGISVGGDSDIDGELTTTGRVTIGAQLDVAGKTTINDNLTVNAATSINGDMKVDNGGITTLTGTLNVAGKTDINNSFNVNAGSPTLLSGTLQVVKNAVFDDDVLIDGMLTVNNNLNLPNLVVSGPEGVAGDHIALFENTGGGNSDGVAIRINNSNLTSENRFMTFFGSGSHTAGRIESFNAPTSLSNMNHGVVYGSRGADYAEWLEKEDPYQTFKVGEVVGVRGGKISRNTDDADHVLTISMAPIVLGNMPDEDRKQDFEKVGFMGQVPALVKGKVAIGDYIVASGDHDGLAKAIPPNKISLNELPNVIGKSWTASATSETSLINVSVGLKSNEWVKVLESQESRINELESKLKAFEDLSDTMKRLEVKLDAIDMN